MTSIVVLLLLILGGLVFLFLKQRKRLNKLAGTLQELEETQEIKEIKSNLEGRDQERVRIANDWHDGIGNSLSTLRLLFDTIQTNNQQSHTEALALLEHTQREFKQIINNELINNFSTEAAIHSCFEQWKRLFALGNIESVFKVYNLLEYKDVPLKIKAHLYRMTQELLTNVLKHSKASKIEVELKGEEHKILLSVKDNGKGMIEAPALRSVRDRLQLLNGEIDVETTEGKGMMVCLLIRVD